jgi:hypothetical protein
MIKTVRAKDIEGAKQSSLKLGSLKDLSSKVYAIENSNCARFEEVALGWTHHQRSSGIVSTYGRGHEIVQGGCCR